MPGSFEHLQQCLKRLPGLGYRSAERLALHLLVEKPEACAELQEALSVAAESVKACPVCGNLCEAELCEICSDTRRDNTLLCVVETVPDLRAMERAGAYRGYYHVLQGKLSPIHGVDPEDLNLESLKNGWMAAHLRKPSLPSPMTSKARRPVITSRRKFSRSGICASVVSDSDCQVVEAFLTRMRSRSAVPWTGGGITIRKTLVDYGHMYLTRSIRKFYTTTHDS